MTDPETKHVIIATEPSPGPRRNPKPFFEAGQRVVCVDASSNRLAPNSRPLIAGKIYVVRAIELALPGSGPGGASTWKASKFSIRAPLP